MVVRTGRAVFCVLLICLVGVLACGSPTSPAASPTQVPPTLVPVAQPPAASATTSSSATGAGGASRVLRQWASEAEASSEYGSSDFSAQQVTGEPNTPECGDAPTAWASVSQDTVEWINAYFQVPTYASEIRIIETYYPDQVAKVELIDMQGQFFPVYTGQPQWLDGPCPYVLSVPVAQGDLLAQGVHITIDQTVVRNWNGIDAVEIIGLPGEGTPVRPPTP
jgi:hypothetical protein